MAVRIIRTVAPPPVPVPRGALWAADAAVWILAHLRRLRRERAHPADDLLALARAIESDEPALAAELRGIAMHRAAQARWAPGAAPT
jgi:hypothetical protein